MRAAPYGLTFCVATAMSMLSIACSPQHERTREAQAPATEALVALDNAVAGPEALDEDEPAQALNYEELDGAEGAERSFMGYECSDDCSGHQAGYDWAERNDLSDPDDCGGNSRSFIEGCRAYAESN